MSTSTVRFSTYPRTEPPPAFLQGVVEVFRAHESEIATLKLSKGLTSDDVLYRLRSDLVQLGFEVEAGKKKSEKIERPVFFGENGIPAVRYEIEPGAADYFIATGDLLAARILSFFEP